MGPTSVTVFGQTHPGMVRTNNEDAFTISKLDEGSAIHGMQSALALSVGDRGVLLAVSDGLGGAQAGEVASAMALHCLRVSLQGARAPSAEAALKMSVEAANQHVWKEATKRAGYRGMGATLTAVFVYDGRAYIAEIGDSRAYLLRGSRFLQLTRDQSYAELMVESGMLRRDQVEHFAYKNVVLQALGTQPDVTVALNRVALRRRDRLLLCSDGLSGKLRDEEMQSILAHATSLETACQTLVTTANDRGGEDNITVIVAEADGEGLPACPEGDRISVEDLSGAA